MVPDRNAAGCVSVMPDIKEIPFRPGMESGWEPLAGATANAINVIIDGKGAVRRRPGIKVYDKALSTAISTEQVIGLASVKDDSELLAWTGVINGPLELHRVQENVSDTIDQDTADFRPTHAETEAMVAWCAGRSISKVLLDNFETSKLQGDPPVASHVIYQGTRVLANSTATDRIRVYYSAPQSGEDSVEGHEQWNLGITALGTSGSFTAESKSDPVVAIAENSNKISAELRRVICLEHQQSSDIFSRCRVDLRFSIHSGEWVFRAVQRHS